ncbi:MAG: hypothetical protein ABW328_05705 [Ilumatobacteraceae bacterium]
MDDDELIEVPIPAADFEALRALAARARMTMDTAVADAIREFLGWAVSPSIG